MLHILVWVNILIALFWLDIVDKFLASEGEHSDPRVINFAEETEYLIFLFINADYYWYHYEQGQEDSADSYNIEDQGDFAFLGGSIV